MGMVELALIGKLKKSLKQKWGNDSHPSTLIEYGIIDAYDDSTVNSLLNLKADKSTTYTKTEVDTAISEATPTFDTILNKPSTIAGYGITDAYTKTEVEYLINTGGSGNIKYYKSETAPIPHNSGDIWFNQTNGITYIYQEDSLGTQFWVELGGGGSSEIILPSLSESDLIVVSNPSTVTYNFTYEPRFIQVFINRLKLRKTEFTATNGTSITINIDLEIDDEIEFVTLEGGI